MACASNSVPSWVQQPMAESDGHSSSACAPAGPDGKTLALLRAQAQFGQRNLVQQHSHSQRQLEQHDAKEQLQWQQHQLSQRNRFGVVPAGLHQTHWQGRFQGQQLHCIRLSTPADMAEKSTARNTTTSL
ncbi:hypothetical protein QWY20_16265 [Alkalimonas sp. MEB108]|uniref:Uncharacterized protein n=1 Tax=Alkalimonas cellulosilytica TaxID=3058395 RepID=A0ABU7J913_9GAMM|nr:hypothetical protein [Alkalimonas sp. MEB108]MEE2003014.1 hypothetical protein [Alkalimonas sp. MEB108]